MSFTGKVARWINRKGYGFINVVDADSEYFGKDLFVHLSGINIDDNQYKSLYPGEYVSFDLARGEDGRDTCVNLRGVLGGPLLIENEEYRYKIYPKMNQDSRNTNESHVDESHVDEDEVTSPLE